MGQDVSVAPVAQGIEHRFPKPCAKVRILPGAHWDWVGIKTARQASYE